MKVLKPRTFIVFAFAALSGALLLYTSQNVQDAQSRLESYERSVENEKEQIRLLRAEWASLNRPERLERLASEFLDVLPPAPEQIIDRDGAYFEVEEAVEFERDFEPVLQPVSAGGEVGSHTAPPAPAPKPPAPSREFREREKKESKDFNKLIGEIGGGQ